jgi:A/G-specific adenine glycosylase
MGYWNRSGRDHLPWRKTRDPYHILVSEMMLQQTQVDRVIPYYERFLKRFPDARSLAAAPLADVLRLWSGLGYNRRAKYLHEAAKRLHTIELSDRRKVSYAQLRELPGVGEYTAKAVRVFAWNEPEALIETNVRTAFIAHFFPRGRKVPDAKLVPLIAEALEGQDPRSWYAALMDYGTYLKATQPNPSRKSKHHSKQTKFEGSMRQVRGAILKACLAGVTLEFVRARHGAKYAIALDALSREGLIVKDGSEWRLAA